MPYDARVLQILIASPGDVPSERRIISDVIYEWNYTNSRERSVVLLPIRWETHASPEMGSRPQAVINEQVVDLCDMAVAVFWMRLGTPTGEAESGTAEEITRMGNAGKTVMLYFSDAQVRPRSIDFIEYQRLLAFQNQTYPNGLIETYESLDEFREKFRRQLAIQITKIISSDSKQQSESVASNQSITLAIAQSNPQMLLSPPSVLELTRIVCTDKNDVPDYSGSGSGSGSSYSAQPISVGSSIVPNISMTNTPNRNFYREIIAYYEGLSLRRQLGLALSSTSDQSMRDIHLDIAVQRQSGQATMNPLVLSWPAQNMDYTSYTSSAFMQSYQQVPDEIRVQNISESQWSIAADVSVVQAQRTVYLSGSFIIAAAEESSFTFDATVYSSGGPPFALQTELAIHIKSHEVPYSEILRATVPGYDEAKR